ncbi:glycosyltransferase family 2 protein [Nonlabens ulvanivorans]|uniref:glycosyltransferase family 2 protein n=1 Tax=Nonlabens ulvanivorans TaxID=906888 RepID=UPI002943A54A|nr:glycosyltransferase family 2 protein [Nonlabens ulvanivorans]WOI23975.1 glycosyltransferase family 2 protein [Nonlabens ulvanivorans]
MKIGIVILNWNGLALLQRYLPSVVLYSKEHTVYVADNASTDASLSWVKEQYPSVKIIAMDENRGYAGGYNVALQSVDEEIICLLNNDIEVTEDWLAPITTLFKSDVTIAAAQPLLLDDKRRTYFEYAGAAGGYLDRLAYPYCRGRIFDQVEENHQQYSDSTNLDWASGAALFVKKKAFLEVGALDEAYFAHQEEIDLCWRLRHAGYKIAIATDATVYHLGGGTLAALNPRKTFYNFRNSLYNIVKNDHSANWLGILFLRMVLDGLAGLQFLFKAKPAHFMAILKAHASFYGGLRTMLQKRQEVKRYAKKTSTKPAVFSIVYQFFVKNRSNYQSVK